MQSGKRLLVQALLWLSLVFLCMPVQAQQASMIGVSAKAIGKPIDQFRVSGNERTQRKYLLHWAELREGQILTIDLLNNALQELRDTDLFKTIRFQTESLENGELTLHIIVEERRSWLLLPRLSRNSDGDIKTGLRLRMYNLQGADRTLDILVQHEDEADGDDAEELRIRYKIPLYNKPYDLAWQANHVIKNTEEDGFENVETINFLGFDVSRDWHIDALTTPLTVRSALALEDRDLDETYPESIEAREEGVFNRIRLGLELDDVHRERYRRFGSLYGIGIQQGFDWLGSDYDATIVDIEAIGFNRLNRYDNFNYRVVLEVSNNSPFDYPKYSIGGGSTIRGLEDFDERGDARWFTNLEYVFSYRKKPAIAHTLFVDFGNVYEKFEDIDITDVHYTLGTGFRWKIESFVKTELFLDYGYSPEEQDGKLYGGTSLNF
jgi:outer membrane protein assembly factor BamA